MRRLLPEVSWMLADGSRRSLGREFVPLLAAIAAHGSLAAAARALALSYRGAWGMIEAAERATGARFVVLERGRGARLARAGERLVAADAGVRELLGTNVAALIVPLREPGRHPSPTVRLRIAASHDMVLAALREAWRTRHGVDVGFHGSAEALALYAAGSVDVAGFHVGASDRIAARDAAPHPRRAAAVPAALAGAHPAARQSEAGEDARRRRAQEPALRQSPAGIGDADPPRPAAARAAASRGVDLDGYANEEFTHAAVAATVAAGKADAGVGLEAAAREFGARVRAAGRRGLPLRLSPPRTALAARSRAFRALIADEATRDAVRHLAGYALDDPGAERGFGRRADGSVALLPA